MKFIPDWTNFQQEKYFIVYNSQLDKYSVKLTYIENYGDEINYFRTKEEADAALKAMEKENKGAVDMDVLNAILTKVKSSKCLNKDELDMLTATCEVMNDLPNDFKEIDEKIEKLYKLYKAEHDEKIMLKSEASAYKSGMAQACHNLEVLTGISAKAYEEGIMNFDLQFYL